MWTFRRPTCVRTSPTPRGPIAGSLEDTDEGSGVHLVGYGHRGKKKVVIATRKLYYFDAKEGKCHSEAVSNVKTLFFEKKLHVHNIVII